MFLRRNYLDTSITVLLPFGSDVCRKDLGDINRIRNILFPTTHYSKVKFFRFSTWMLFFWKKLINLFITRNKHFLLKISVLLTFPYFILRKANIIVFPTACPQSLKLIELFEIFNIRINIHLHFTNTSETRKPFGDENLVKKFLKNSTRFKSVNLVCSFETRALHEFYSEFGCKKKFYFARSPSTELSISKSKILLNNEQPEIINVFIMGTSNRGGKYRHQVIEKSLEIFSSKIYPLQISKFKVIRFSILQESELLFTKYKKFQNTSIQIDKLEFKMNFPDLVNKLRTAHILILPYDPEAYLMRGSSLLFLASDLKIPVIAPKFIDFTRDISDFNLGKVFNIKETFANELLQSILSLSTFEFDKYLEARELENKKIYDSLGL